MSNIKIADIVAFHRIDSKPFIVTSVGYKKIKVENDYICGSFSKEIFFLITSIFR